MDQVTQQNAALVEEAAAAAESMQQQAKQLAAAVAVFKLDATSVSTEPLSDAVRRDAKPLARRDVAHSMTSRDAASAQSIGERTVEAA
jgi:hypothetical protein